MSEATPLRPFRSDGLHQHNFTSYQELLPRTIHNLQCLHVGQLKLMHSTDCVITTFSSDSACFSGVQLLYRE